MSELSLGGDRMKYEIKGGNLPVLLIHLDAGEMIECEAGAMSWMDEGIEMQTQGGGLGKMFGRLLTNESAFVNHYTARVAGEIAFASKFPGSIKAVRVTPAEPIYIQKGAYLCSMGRIDSEVYIQKKFSGGLFGGEGFLMRKYHGDGIVFLEIDGSAIEYDLAPGQKKIIDTGHVVALQGNMSLDVVQIKGVKNVLLGGEGLFNTVVTGPGRLTVQTMPISQTAMLLYNLMPHSSS